MLTPDYLTHVADDIVELYDQLNTSIVKDIARRIARIGVSESTVIQIERAQEAGKLFREIIDEVSEITGKSQQEIKAAFMKAGATSMRYDNEIYKRAGLEPIPIMQSQRMLDVLLAGMAKTRGVLNNLTLTTAVTGQQAFVDATNLAYMQTASGAMSYTQATVEAVRKLAVDGISTVQYNNSVDQLDVAVSRAVVTGVNQTMAQLQLAQMDQLGVDLVATSAHYGARPSHRPWQGRIFSRGGKDKKYPDFVSSTGYGTGAGLCGWNCRHSFFPFFEGSEPEYDPDDLEAMDKRTVQFEGRSVDQYEASQKQRRMERGIRATKREAAAFDAARNAAKDPETRAAFSEQFGKASVKLKAQTDKLDQFVRETKLPRQREREQVNGFSRSQASKATWAARKRS